MNIVLVPGILGFNRIGPISYFNGVAEHLGRIFPFAKVLSYFEVVGSGREGIFQTSAFFAPTFTYLSAVSGQNDGVVPYASATRGRAPVAVWAGDHADLIGHNLDGPPFSNTSAFQHLSAYWDLVREVILPTEPTY